MGVALLLVSTSGSVEGSGTTSFVVTALLVSPSGSVGELMMTFSTLRLPIVQTGHVLVAGIILGRVWADTLLTITPSMTNTTANMSNRFKMVPSAEDRHYLYTSYEMFPQTTT
jgi:hypothetical protein